MNHPNGVRGVKLCKVDLLQRPGIARPFVLPSKLNFQLRDTDKTGLRFSPAGKNLVGGTQWAISVIEQRPGIAKPVIQAKHAERDAGAAAAKAVAKAAGVGPIGGPGPQGGPGVNIGKPIAKQMAAIKKMEKAEAHAAEKAVAKAAARAAGFGRYTY